jgi:hypothetical protein
MTPNQEAAYEKAFKEWYKEWTSNVVHLTDGNKSLMRAGFRSAYALQESRLEIAVKALEEISNKPEFNAYWIEKIARTALKEIGVDR